MRCSASIFAMIGLAAVLCAPVILEAQYSLMDPVTPASATVVATGVPTADDAAIGTARGSRIFAGAAVYSERNERIGSIREVRFGNSDDSYSVVLSLGDFGGIAGTLIEIPGNLIQLENGKLMIAGVTRDQLMQLPKYQYGSRS